MSRKNTNNPEGKKNYELAFLIKEPSFEKAILDLLAEYKTSIIKQPSVKALKLAYPIKKHASAYFGYVNFEASPADIKPISDTLRFNNGVLRFLTVVMPINKEVSTKYETKSKKIDKAETTAGTLTNEALEETLEEILK